MEEKGNSSEVKEENTENSNTISIVDLLKKQIIQSSSSSLLQITGGGAEQESLAKSTSLVLTNQRKKLLVEQKLKLQLEWKEAARKKVEVRSHFVNNLVTLPELVWEKIFKNLEDPKEKAVLMSMAPIWREALLPDRKTVLFYFVVPILYKTGLFTFGEILGWREVCKDWKNAVGEHLPEFFEFKTTNVSIWDDLVRNVPSLPTTPAEDIKFLQKFDEDGPNPFEVTKYLKIKGLGLLNSADNDDNDNVPYAFQGNLVLESPLVSHWARELHGLLIDHSHRPFRNSMTLQLTLRVLLRNAQNLRTFAFNGLHLNYLEPFEIRSNQLEAVAFFHTNVSTVCKVLLDHNDTLKTIILAGKNEGNRRPGNLIPFIKIGPFPQLKDLCLLEIYQKEEVPNPGPEKFVRMSKEVQFAPSLEHFRWTNMVSSTKDVLNSIEWVNLFGENLFSLDITFLNIYSRLIKFTERELTSLWLHLPRLNTLCLKVEKVSLKNIDFLLPLESLRSFGLWYFQVAKNSSEGNGEKRKEKQKQKSTGDNNIESPSKEIIRFKGFEARMYESNIWDILPELRFFQISVVTRRQVGTSFETEKATRKVYTREGFKKYLEGQKE